MSNIDIVKINKMKTQTPSIKSLFFEWDKEIDPGQFVMVWVPGVDEVPMSLSHQKDRQGITVRNVGSTTKALHELEKGDKIGIRGPFGRGYSLLEHDEILAVIGGIGGASIRPAIVELVSKGKIVKCALGAESKEELLFEEELSELTRLHVTTDDGSKGHDGFVTEIIGDMMENTECVLTCGPEPMMKKTVEISTRKNVPVQASLERYMKCGLGLCDSCSIDGYQVCRDGPVFYGDELEEMDEFGKFERDKSGRRVRLC
ncbi:MAG: dihydroorotate dehydrogenase electron transfer subunit [Candidatus Saliniplasma sp.]